ncbi:hypothetical protein Pmani_024041 [Petrolisthes manimaculis]|uniref:Uncharacterized protein n=1 Tax=Petrolisthes manimaculis TaxID=1843537 RepID=A0AAE1PAU3_9EUCA|nr:hypothetical protein Pmani_024041 [Petrolisthes manimaculis]
MDRPPWGFKLTTPEGRGGGGEGGGEGERGGGGEGGEEGGGEGGGGKGGGEECGGEEGGKNVGKSEKRKKAENENMLHDPIRKQNLLVSNSPTTPQFPSNPGTREWEYQGMGQGEGRGHQGIRLGGRRSRNSIVNEARVIKGQVS